MNLGYLAGPQEKSGSLKKMAKKKTCQMGSNPPLDLPHRSLRNRSLANFILVYHLSIAPLFSGKIHSIYFFLHNNRNFT
jgi:hypothetical protein